MNIDILPYNESYNDGILKLEEMTTQGKILQLRIVKHHFLDRAVVFNKYYGCLAVDPDNKPVGTMIGSKTRMILNGEIFDAGIGYDIKVHPGHRNKGIAKRMTKYIYKQFFKPEGLKKNFGTLKRSNSSVIRLASKALKGIWLYDFVYLTLPVKIRIKTPVTIRGKRPLLSVTLFDHKDIPDPYYTQLHDGPGYFHTYRLYHLKVGSIPLMYRLGIQLLKKIRPGKFVSLPFQHDKLEFATLYNHNENNIHRINEVMDQLEEKGIKYLLVCCRKNDRIYNALKKISINTYGYYILSDFEINRNDELTIDVRCL